MSSCQCRSLTRLAIVMGIGRPQLSREGFWCCRAECAAETGTQLVSSLDAGTAMCPAWLQRACSIGAPNGRSEIKQPWKQEQKRRSQSWPGMKQMQVLLGVQSPWCTVQKQPTSAPFASVEPHACGELCLEEWSQNRGVGAAAVWLQSEQTTPRRAIQHGRKSMLGISPVVGQDMRPSQPQLPDGAPPDSFSQVRLIWMSDTPVCMCPHAQFRISMRLLVTRGSRSASLHDCCQALQHSTTLYGLCRRLQVVMGKPRRTLQCPVSGSGR